MKNLFALAAVAVAVAACPQPTVPDPITSVDGLEGGRIDGNVEADSLKAGSLSASSANIAGDVSVEGSVNASSVDVETLTVNGAVTAQSLSVESAAFQQRPTLQGVALVPEIAGVATRDGERTAAAAEASCAGAFVGSHICSEGEFLQALPFFDGAAAILLGAAVNVASPRVVRRLSDGTTERELIVDNCGNWVGLASNVGAVSTDDGGVDPITGFTVLPFAHARTAVATDDSGRVFLNFSTECAETAIDLVCCN